MSAYGRFTQTGNFRALIAEFSVMAEGEGADPLLVHTMGCNEGVCVIEQDDSMDVLVQTVIEHECPDSDVV